MADDTYSLNTTLCWVLPNALMSSGQETNLFLIDEYYWAEDYCKYTMCQMGLRTHHSTLYAIFVLHNAVQHCLNQKGSVYCAFVDYKRV